MTNQILVNLLILLEIMPGKTNSGFPKTFQGDIFLYLWHIFATAAPKREQKIQKLYFGFRFINYWN